MVTIPIKRIGNRVKLVSFWCMTRRKDARHLTPTPTSTTLTPSTSGPPLWGRSFARIKARGECDDRRPVSTLPRPISNFLNVKKYRKTFLYIKIHIHFPCLFSLYVNLYIYSVPHWIPQGNKLCWKAFSIALICKYITYIGLIGKVFGTIVCICYLWVIGYRVRLRG